MNEIQPGSTARVVELARRSGVLRPRDLTRIGIARSKLDRLYRAGRFERVGRGLYVPVDTELTEFHTLAEVCARVPHGVVCLLSALAFHGIGTQQPFEVWLAIDVKGWAPRIPELPMHLVRFSGPALTEGIEEHTIEGVRVPVYSPAKTVADCFKYRNKLGLDVALEALRDVWRRRLVTMDQLWHAARVCRVANVMKPYLESLA